MENLYVINNLYFLDRYIESLYKGRKTYSYEEANKIISENLYKKDLSSKIKDVEPLKIPIKLLNYKPHKTVKSYSFNILKYEPRLSGFTFNIAIIIWNKETNEYLIKFIKDEDINKLVSIMPKTNFIFEIKKNFDYFFKEPKSIEEIKKMIISYFGKNYPLEYFFKYEYWHTWLQYDEDNIKKVGDDLYNSYIDYIFKSN